MKEKFVLNKKVLSFILLIMLGLAFIFVYYGKVVLSPNQYFFSDNGDGIKNYFTLAYHIKHDTSYIHHNGMNYPYGEHFLYTDCHPLLANTLKLFSGIFPFINDYSVGILNFLLIFSIFITFIILYLLLLEFKINVWWSVLFSFCITMLAPQITRISGHYALSYSFAIPLTWLLTLKCVQKPKFIFWVFLFVNNLILMFTHAYLGIIAIAFIIIFLLLNVISNEIQRATMIRNIGLILIAIFPVFIFYFFLTITDTHTGRTINPSGFFLYNAEIDDILIPPGKPIRPFLDKISGGVIKLQWEAGGYLGFINVLFFIALIFLTMFGIFTKKIKLFLKLIFSNRTLNLALIASVIILFFAFAFPFKQFPSLIDFFPLLKQFRATGRFVWPFYFVFTIFVAFAFRQIITTYFNKQKRFFLTSLVLSIYLIVHGMEGLYYHNNESERISKFPNLFCAEQLPDYFTQALGVIKTHEYQAIISIPFYYYGSESYYRPRHEEAVKNSLVLSCHTGLPNICANLTRTSIEESKRIVQIVSPNYYDKKIKNDFKNKKNFLIVKTENQFTKYESNILKKARTIFKSKNLELLSISFSDLFKDERQEQFKIFQQKISKLVKDSSFYVSEKNAVLWYNDFEKTPSDIVFRGKGSYSSVKKGKNILAEFSPNSFENETDYECSIWMYNGEPDALNLWFRLMIEEYDESDDQWYSTTFFPEHAEVIDGNWSLVEGKFRVRNNNNRVYIVTKGKDDSKASLHVDDLLIKKSGTEIYRIDTIDNALFYNNNKINF